MREQSVQRWEDFRVKEAVVRVAGCEAGRAEDEVDFEWAKKVWY